MSYCFIINKKIRESDNQEQRVLLPIIKPKKNIEIILPSTPTEKDSDKPGSELLFTVA